MEYQIEGDVSFLFRHVHCADKQIARNNKSEFNYECDNACDEENKFIARSDKLTCTKKDKLKC